MKRTFAQYFLASVAVLSIATVAQAQSVMTHHTRPAAMNGTAQAMGRLPQNQVMQLDVVLPMRDAAGLDAFLADVYDPSSPNYRHFLSPAQFTERFGPSQADYDRVTAYLKSNGFVVTGGSRDGMEIQVRGPVSSVEAAFHVAMHSYKHPTENRNFYAPDREPTTGLGIELWHVSGLDNYSIPHPMLSNRNDYAKAHGMAADKVVSHATTGSGPSASFLGSDMRAAYYGGSTLTGAGQNLGLFEYLGTNLADLNAYFTNVGQTNNVPVSVISTDGTSTACNAPNCDDIEQTLDMTQAIGMAPGLSSLVMYVGNLDTAIISAMTTHNPLPTTIGCSWGWTPADPSTLDPYFKKMAAQGQNFFAASGDSATWSRRVEAWPADDDYVVSVGGTDLITASAGGAWKSETAWASSGGGINLDGIAIPAWQQLSGVINTSNKGSATLRNGPDVSANANYTFYTCGDQKACLANSYGGTSFAAPMWAGYIALVNEQLAKNSQPPIGFINPTVYAQNVTSAYTTNFHDVTSGTSGSYSAVTGYDLVTGWGSPNGANLINALAPTSSNPSFTISASPASVSVSNGSTGNSGTSTISITPVSGFSSGVALSATGLPSGVTASFNPTSVNGGQGSSTLTLTAGSTAAPGSYTVTVTGTGGGVTRTTTVSLTVTGTTTQGTLTLTSSKSTLSVSRSGGSATATISATASGLTSPISLTVTGLPSGVSASFSPASIAAGGGSSTLTITAKHNASIGSATITVKGTSGSTNGQTTISLSVTK